MITKKPLVTAIMPVYNAELYLREAIDSIVNQTYTNWELLIIDDCSTDGSWEIIISYDDPRIIVLKNEENQGHHKTGNKGIRMAKGKYITRMDADDISLPRRFEKQVCFLEEHPESVLCASHARVIGDFKNLFVVPKKDELIKLAFLFQNPLIHSSVMVRAETLKRHAYPEDVRVAGDFQLWVDMQEEGMFSSIPEVLFEYRMHEKNITSTSGKTVSLVHTRILSSQLGRLGIEPTDREMFVHVNFSQLKNRKDIEPDTFLSDLRQWMLKLLDANQVKQIYDQKTMERMFSFRWILACSFLGRKKKILPLPIRKNALRYPYVKLLEMLYQKKQG
ncbi:glycosyltransferase family 2 protein [Bacteroidales bacterium OttesenSCG-928-L03]|nr:glycosyltransferase family 2 protein [Bacteroidales bacterium OttesenSCG-928-L03]